MKRLILLSALALGGCGTVTPGTISDRAKEIQGYTKLACSFVPTVATVAAILTRGGSAGTAQIAQDICAAVTTAPLAEGPGKRPRPTVNGVVIRGSFVK